MTKREITTLMHRLFYGCLPGNNAWVHLMQEDEVDKQKVMLLIDEYIEGDALLLFATAQNCLCCSKVDAFENIKRLLAFGTLKIADPLFIGRVLIEPSLGAGAGHKA